MTSATVFNVQRFSLHDGPGIRTTVFLKGCVLRCSWCHNPEGLDPRPELSRKAERCLGCEFCADACPEDLAGSLKTPDSTKDPSVLCRYCGACADACPTGAREWLGRDMNPDELIDELLRDRPYYESSGGGVTFSGGEPLRADNIPFLRRMLTLCGGHGLHRAVDTCGRAPTPTLLEIAGLSDLLLYDLKVIDPARHLEATGEDNEQILANLRAVVAAGHRVWIRVPLVPGWTDDEANLTAIGEFARELDRPCPVYLLPYHGMARDKYARLGREYSHPELSALEPDQVARRAAILEDGGLEVHIGGG